MKTKSTSSVFIIVLVIILAVVLISFFYSSTPKKPKNYSNRYGYSMVIPAGWKYKESENGTSLRINSGRSITSQGVPDGIIDLAAVYVDIIPKSEFGLARTKVGEIAFDLTKSAFFDVGSNPPRCLEERNQIGIMNKTDIPYSVIMYGGSLMSDPVHEENAIITDKDYLIVIKIEEEVGQNTMVNQQIRDEETQMLASFRIAENVKTLKQGCSSTKNK